MANEIQTPPTPAMGLLLRIYWLMFGNLFLVLGVVFIFKNKFHPLFLNDILYWCSAIGLILARYFDIRNFNGETGSCEPATMAHFKKYAVIVSAISVLAWIAAHIIKFYLLK